MRVVDTKGYNYYQQTYVLDNWSDNRYLCDNTLGVVEQTFIEM